MKLKREQLLRLSIHTVHRASTLGENAASPAALGAWQSGHRSFSQVSARVNHERSGNSVHNMSQTSLFAQKPYHKALGQLPGWVPKVPTRLWGIFRVGLGQLWEAPGKSLSKESRSL